jgi:hypothetical protein
MRLRRVSLCLAVGLALAALLGACSGDDDTSGGDGETTAGSATATAEDISELETVATRLFEAGTGDAQFFVDHVTVTALTLFGYPSAEACLADAAGCVGEGDDVTAVGDTQISGESGSTLVTSAAGGLVEAHFIREGGEWKLNGFAVSAVIPEGVNQVEVTAIDFGYEWDPGQISDGNFAFVMKNEGQQQHEMAVALVTEGYDAQAVIDAAESGELVAGEIPPGVDRAVGFAFGSPGTTSKLVFEGGLQPGRYAMLCFIPDENGTPHVVLGMHSEFTVP